MSPSPFLSHPDQSSVFTDWADSETLPPLCTSLRHCVRGWIWPVTNMHYRGTWKNTLKTWVHHSCPVVGRTMPSHLPWCPHPHSRNQGILLPYMAKGTLCIWYIKDLEVGDYPGLSGWAQTNYKGPYKWQSGCQTQREIWRFSSLQKLEKRRNGFFPRASRRNLPTSWF